MLACGSEAVYDIILRVGDCCVHVMVMSSHDRKALVVLYAIEMFIVRRHGYWV